MDERIGMGVLVALLVLSLAGCGQRDQEPEDANQSTAGQLTEKAGQAVQGAGDFLAQQKDKLLAASQEQLDKLEQQVDEWLAESDIDDEQVRQKLNTVGQSFRNAADEARQAIAGAKDSGIEAWQQVKPTVEKAVQKAQQAHDEIMAYLRQRAANQESGSDEPVVEE